MHIIEQRETLVLTNGEGTPRHRILLQALFVLPITIAILAVHVSAAMHGWSWAWLAVLLVPIVMAAYLRSWQHHCHATVEIDRSIGQVRVERRYALRTRAECMPLRDIAALEVETAHRATGNDIFAPVLALRDGRRISLGP